MDEEHRKVLVEHVHYLRDELDKRGREAPGMRGRMSKRLRN
jgi:hypothetical protein